jgi:S-adenosylmethionine:tRNA ribosyltransferase-isomerase
MMNTAIINNTLHVTHHVPRITPRNMLDFTLPAHLEASEPPEARGLRRDDVRLMVSYFRDGDRISHSHFRDLVSFLQAGDVLVINTSGTLNASLPAFLSNNTPIRLNLSTRLSDDVWVVELRTLSAKGTAPFFGTQAGEVVTLPNGGRAVLHSPYAGISPRQNAPRLWTATLQLPQPILPYLSRYGAPIRYGYVPDSWGGDYYQTVYANEMGSAEMPSAGRAFTPELLTKLVAKGVIIAPILLHTGVASLEAEEPPYPEFYRVPEMTARVVNMAKNAGNRIIAVGTTAVRALESASSPSGIVFPNEDWTDLVITPERGLHVVDGMLTGLHEPRASHLAMLEALAGRDHLAVTYGEALREQYLWHEFGDLHLLLP